MPETQTPPQYGTQLRPPPDPAASRRIVVAVVTEVAAALEPVARDPFLDDGPFAPPVPCAPGRLAGLRCP